MKNVVFNTETKIFSCESTDGRIYEFEYHPATKNLWKNLNENDFSVELLINPYLNLENDIYTLKEKSNGRIGYIFPVAVLDSIQDLSDYNYIENYIFISYKTLLGRIQVVTSEHEFSRNFEDNVCVCVINLKGLSFDDAGNKPLPYIIHSLRHYSYSYFEANNSISAVPNYDRNKFFKKRQSCITVSFRVPILYEDDVIDNLLRELPKICNLTHRFVILYQFIEYLMDMKTLEEISLQIQKYNQDKIPSNEFIDNVKNLSTERMKINAILTNSQCNDALTDFVQSFSILANEIGYDMQDLEAKFLFYSFRNQMTHCYRKIHKFQKDLANVIQSYEKVILTVIENYKPVI